MNLTAKTLWLAAVCSTLALSFSACRQSSSMSPPVSIEPDLVIFTSQEENIYEPIIKEFKERTGYVVEVRTGTPRELLSMAASGEKTDVDGDLLFGIGVETLEASKYMLEPYESADAYRISEAFQSPDHSWTSFSALPLVIIYNTKVVTYREVPDGWKSLLEPRWKGRIAFVDPLRSDLYAAALVTAASRTSQEDYLTLLAENLNYMTLPDFSSVNEKVADGQYSLGVTLEGAAQSMLSKGDDIDYLYPAEGVAAIPDGTAILKDCPHPAAARQFVDFTVSDDVQRILGARLNRRSVRKDILPSTGLTSTGQLPLITFDLNTYSRQKQEVLEEWRSLLERHDREVHP